MSRCRHHGALIDPITGECATLDVLVDVGMERARQYKLHGANLKNHSGTGPDVPWAEPLFSAMGATTLEFYLREAYNAKQGRGEIVTWLDILLEEFSEAAMERDPKRLDEELIQVAAVCVSWVEKLRDPESSANPIEWP